MSVYYKLHTLLIFLIALAAFTPEARAAEKVLDIRAVKSESGIEAWLVEDHSVPVIALEFAFRNAGSAYDPPDLQGLAQMASNTMDEGAGNLGPREFQEELRNLSISLRFNSGRDSYGGSLKTLTKNKARAFELLKTALEAPRFEQDAVERMRRANQSRIRASLSDPDWLAARVMNDVAFAGHPYALNSGGTISSLEKIGPSALKDFHKQHIGRNKLVVSAAGDITAEELAGVLEDIFGDLPEVEVAEVADLSLQNEGKTFHVPFDAPQSVIEITQPGIARTDPDYFTAQVMNFILGSSGFGSRLTEVIREERGLTYGIYSQLSTLDHISTLSVSTSTASENVAQVRALIKGEFEKMKNEEVSAKELADAKAYLIGALPLSLTSTDRIAGLLLSLKLDGLPIDYLEQRQSEIETTTAQEVLALAQNLLEPERFITVVSGQSAPEGAQTVESLPNAE